MNSLNIPCRYYRVYTDMDVPCDEQNFHFVEKTLPIPIEQAALVLVDVWNTHYIDSWLKRAADVTQSKLVPLLEAARGIGLTIVHAPSPRVTERRYPEVVPGPSPQTSDPDEWPPRAFHSLYRTGDDAPFGRQREPRLDAFNKRSQHTLDIAETATPRPDEPVITDGNQLHSLLKERKILHLFYAGFATNWCIINRNYGLIEMGNRGYNIILIRDATTGVEFHDSVDQLTATNIAIREIETKYAWSATVDEFVTASENAT